MQAKFLSIDVGSGSIKAVSDDGKRKSFSAVLAPVREDDFDGIFNGNGSGHRATISHAEPNGDGSKRDWLVGDMAAKSPMAMVSLSYEKEPEFHDALLLTAAYLLGAGEPTAPGAVSLAVGVPLAIYKKGKSALKTRLGDLSAKVRVNGGEERFLSFTRVEVYPQCAGVVMAVQGQLPEGLTGIIDIGKYTTDIILIYVVNGRPEALGDEYRASLPNGTYLVERTMMTEFRKLTGKPLELVESSAVTMKALGGQPLMFDGKKYDLQPVARRAVRDTAMIIHQGISSTWGTKLSRLENVLLAGGGALLFGELLAAALPNVRVVEDPVYSNALGYLKALNFVR